MNPELIALVQMLSNHDWHFDHSDDHSVWKRGMAEHKAIHAEQIRLISEGVAAAEELTELMDKYRPKVS
jgi:hypothetical protein